MLIMQLCQPLVLIFQFFKIFEQRTLAPPKFESWFRPCPKLFEYTFCTLNYSSCYTLHPKTLDYKILLLKFFKIKNTDNN